MPFEISAVTRASFIFKISRPCDDMPNDFPFSIKPRIARDLLSISENPRVRANAFATGSNRGSASSLTAIFALVFLAMHER
jgi:hypothetical protein